MSAVIEEHHDDHHDHKPTGIGRWLFSTNHKDIGTMYLWFSFIMFFIGGTLALVIRAELFEPGLQFVEPEMFNQLTTLHGLIMVFGVIMPGFVGLANWMVPLMIGAPDMALPRMNNWSFWLLPGAFGLLLASLAMSLMGMGSAPNFGWTFYAPLSTTYGPEHYRYNHQYACSWHDIHEDAYLCMDMVHHCILTYRCNACIGWCGNNDVD
jgi:cytochrome c oxidase subunit 1